MYRSYPLSVALTSLVISLTRTESNHISTVTIYSVLCRQGTCLPIDAKPILFEPRRNYIKMCIEVYFGYSPAGFFVNDRSRLKLTQPYQFSRWLRISRRIAKGGTEVGGVWYLPPTFCSSAQLGFLPRKRWNFLPILLPFSNICNMLTFLYS